MNQRAAEEDSRTKNREWDRRIEAALQRKVYQLQLDLLRDPIFWDALESYAGLYCILFPLRTQIMRRLQRYRRNPRAAYESVGRLIQNRCWRDPRYRSNVAHFFAVGRRISERLQEPDPRSAPRLSKYQRKQLEPMLGFLSSFFPPGNQMLSAEAGEKAVETMYRLSKTGPGRKLESDSRKIVALYRSGVRGWGRMASEVWPERWQQAGQDERQQMKDRVRQVIRRHKRTLSAP